MGAPSVAAHTCPSPCRGRHARPVVRVSPCSLWVCGWATGHCTSRISTPQCGRDGLRKRRLTAPLPGVHPGVDTAEGQRVVHLLGPVRRRRCPARAGWAAPGSPPGGWSCDARNLRGRRHRHGGRGAGGRVVQGAGGLRAINRLRRPGAGGPDRRRRVQLLLPAGGVLQAVAQGPGAGARTRCVGRTGGGDSRAQGSGWALFAFMPSAGAPAPF